MKRNIDWIIDESGSVLVIVMVVLVAVTALSLTMMNFTTQEMKMASHYKFDKEAFYNGDSGIYGTPKFIRTLFPNAEPVAEEDPQKAGCIRYLNASGGNAADIVMRRIYGYPGDTTAIYNDFGTLEESPTAGDISFNACGIPSAINIIRLGGDAQMSGGAIEFAAGADGLGSGGGEQAVRFRLVSTGSDAQGNTHTIRAIWRYKNIPGGL
jgi:hypothetical protein